MSALQQESKYCEQCGTRLGGDVKFCEACGCQTSNSGTSTSEIPSAPRINFGRMSLIVGMGFVFILLVGLGGWWLGKKPNATASTNHDSKSDVTHEGNHASEFQHELTDVTEPIVDPDEIFVTESGEDDASDGNDAASPPIPNNRDKLPTKRLSDPVSLGSLSGWLVLQPWFKALEKSMPSGVTLSIEEHDTEDPKWKVLQIREIHSPESGYDPNVSPTVGIFKVSADRKTTHWLDPVSDEWKPVAAFLKSRNIANGQPVSNAAASIQKSNKAHTPARGSSERVAISDSMRAHVIKGHGAKKLPKFLFKIEFIRVNGDYAGFQGFPVKPDGSYFPDGIFEDVVHTTLLVKKNGKWRVVVDLSRSDVPTPQEARQIKTSIPAGFPSDVIPAFWREHLKL